MIPQHLCKMTKGSSAPSLSPRCQKQWLANSLVTTLLSNIQGVKSQFRIFLREDLQEVLTWIQLLHPSGGKRQLDLSDLPQGDQEQTLQSNRRISCLTKLLSLPAVLQPLKRIPSFAAKHIPCTKAHCSLLSF